MTDPQPIWRETPNPRKLEIVSDLLAQHKTSAQIADRFQDVSRAAVIAFCRRNGLSMANNSPRLAEARRAAVKSGKPVWQDVPPRERAVLVRQAIERGLTGKMIALLFEGATETAVSEFCRTYKIKMLGRAPFRRSAAEKPAPRSRHRDEPGLMTYNEALAAKTCKWPTWDRFEGPDVSRCCGRDRVGAGPYCQEHTRRAAGRMSDLEEDTSDNA